MTHIDRRPPDDAPQTKIIKREKGGYAVYKHDGSKKLSRVYKTKEEAVKRLQQIEYFKHAK